MENQRLALREKNRLLDHYIRRYRRRRDIVDVSGMECGGTEAYVSNRFRGTARVEVGVASAMPYSENFVGFSVELAAVTHTRAPNHSAEDITLLVMPLSDTHGTFTVHSDDVELHDLGYCRGLIPALVALGL